MKKPHDDDYSKQERKLLSVAASMLQAYAGVFSAVIYQQIATSPASPELLISFALFVGQLRCSWDYFKSRLAQDRQQHIEKKEAYIEKSGAICFFHLVTEQGLALVISPSVRLQGVSALGTSWKRNVSGSVSGRGSSFLC